jgi:hypothetical protein
MGEEDSAPPATPAPSSPATPVCPVAFCPVGMALTAVQGAGPDVIEHLLHSAREFLLAAKALVDSRAEGLQGQGDRPLERIEIG